MLIAQSGMVQLHHSQTLPLTRLLLLIKYKTLDYYSTMVLVHAGIDYDAVVIHFLQDVRLLLYLIAVYLCPSTTLFTRAGY